jgi:hypothetical protein
MSIVSILFPSNSDSICYSRIRTIHSVPVVIGRELNEEDRRREDEDRTGESGEWEGEGG